MNWSKEKKVEIWKNIILNKIKNQKQMLIHAKTDKKAIDMLQSYIETAVSNNSMQELSQIEAVSARVYFSNLFGKGFKRSNDCVINAGLNYGYALLRSYISTIIVAKGLHPSLGICHDSMLNNFNLADDIIEIFRPLVDYAVYEKYSYFDEFTKEFRVHLLNILLQKVIVNNKEISIKNAIESYIRDLILYFDNDGIIVKFPKLDVNIYEY